MRWNNKRRKTYKRVENKNIKLFRFTADKFVLYMKTKWQERLAKHFRQGERTIYSSSNK